MKPLDRILCAGLSAASSATATLMATFGFIWPAALCLLVGVGFAVLLFIDDYDHWRDG
jgi:hypothetical protein